MPKRNRPARLTAEEIAKRQHDLIEAVEVGQEPRKPIRIPVALTVNETIALNKWQLANRVSTRNRTIRKLLHIALAAEGIEI